MNIDISFKVDEDKVKEAAEQLGKTPMGMLREIERESQEMGRNLFRKIVNKTRIAENDISFLNYLHSDGLLYLPIQISGYPVERVVGGIKVDSKNKETKEMETQFYLLASTYGSFLMFRIEGVNAIWCGGLNGTVQERFRAANFSDRFRYYSTVYQKLSPEQILSMYDPDKIYIYKVESE